MSIMLYVHIPFCVRKCGYCDFLSFPVGECCKETKDGFQVEAYIDRLCEDIESGMDLFAGERPSVSSIFFGGGTPSLLDAELLRRVMLTVRANFPIEEDAEISIEVNPCTASYEKLSALKAMGFNRISFGVQSFCDEELRELGRVHDSARAMAALETARGAGFTNVNLDLMSAIPGQTLESYRENLETAISLRPTHISAYSLILEEGTPFFEKYKEGMGPLPDEDTEREMYELTECVLSEAGYHRYEISNYALPGYECRHNCGYWERREYVGFGLGAASLLGHKRITVTGDLGVYITREKAERLGEVDITRTSPNSYLVDITQSTHLSGTDEISEFMFLGMRMMRGVRNSDFRSAFRADIMDYFAQPLEKLIRQGLVTRTETEDGDIVFGLTKRGIDVSNVVFAEFLLD